MTTDIVTKTFKINFIGEKIINFKSVRFSFPSKSKRPNFPINKIKSC